MNDIKLIPDFANLAMAYNADTPFRATLLIMPEMISFTLCEDKEDDPEFFESLRIGFEEPESKFEAALLKLTDMLCFELPEQFELRKSDYADSMAAYYKKHGTKGEL